jgi:exopolysaccharide biosynthesis polyprenyl glycosylphosphotransferase
VQQIETRSRARTVRPRPIADPPAPPRPAACNRVEDDGPRQGPVDLGLTTPTRSSPLSPPPRRAWERRLLVTVVMADVLTILLANILTWAIDYRATTQALAIFSFHLPYIVIGLAIVPVWLLFLAVGGAYDPSLLGNSADEYSRVASVAAGLLTVVCAFSFLGSVALSRGLIALFFPALIVLGVFNRFVVRKSLHRRRGLGEALRDIAVVGDREAIAHLNDHLQRSLFAGYRVVGAYVPGGPVPELDGDPSCPPVLGAPDQLVADLDTLDIDAIAVTGHGLFESESLRSLAWRLHGSGVQLLMAPDLVDIAGPRIVSRPAAGLPMLLVEEPRTTGPAQLVKTVTERLIAAGLLVLLLPVVLVVALLVKVTSRGPVLFRQIRIGRDGRPFQMFKFRSMVDGAHERRRELLADNEHDGPMFKIRNDPRITSVGRHLRRYSLDELPQLWNVVRGDMALVGPRPPLASEVERYGGDIGRRLMVKPGITGLWQVSGRADLTWSEAVRLDLYYVENWSLPLDLAILVKTAKTVLMGSGAY